MKDRASFYAVCWRFNSFKFILTDEADRSESTIERKLEATFFETYLRARINAIDSLNPTSRNSLSMISKFATITIMECQIQNSKARSRESTTQSKSNGAEREALGWGGGVTSRSGSGRCRPLSSSSVPSDSPRRRRPPPPLCSLQLPSPSHRRVIIIISSSSIHAY